MSEFAGSVVIHRPLHEVWEFISDPRNVRIWGRSISDVALSSPLPIGVGTTFRIGLAGQPMAARVVAHVADRMFAMEFTSGPVTGSIVSYELDRADDGTKLTRELVLRTAGMWKLAYPIMRYREIRGRETGVANIKRLLESRPIPAAQPA